ncbi:hypothetical protein D3C85_1639570 [compost metagenome]
MVGLAGLEVDSLFKCRSAVGVLRITCRKPAVKITDVLSGSGHRSQGLDDDKKY